MVKCSCSQRWWESSKGWESLVKIAQEVRRRNFRKDEEGSEGRSFMGSPGCQSGGEMEKRRTDEGKKQILSDSNLIVNWMNGEWKINNQNFKKMIQRTQHMLDKVDLRPMADLDKAI